MCFNAVTMIRSSAKHTTRTELHLVWLKKDLRLSDHLPLTHALARQAQEGGALALVYAYEPTLLASPDCAAQHTGFATECLQALRQQLPGRVPLVLVNEDIPPCLHALAEQFQRVRLYSHEETGNWASYQRDIVVAQVCKDRGWEWLEVPSNGVVRRLNNRDNWSALWDQTMQSQPLPVPSWTVRSALTQAQAVNQIESALASMRHRVLWGCDGVPPSQDDWPADWLAKPLTQQDWQDKPARQRGGRAAAEGLLHEFLTQRGEHYRREMSSPLTAESACSRLSPYLAYGVMSIREVVHALWQARQHWLGLSDVRHPSARHWLQSIKSFESRLHWHCHFIQKLESEPELEFHAAHRGLDHLRNSGPLSADEKARLDAWINGCTGFPMIDACMRMLKATGWVNFRMRAMLVAFASYQLWLDWRHTAPLLAREFLDYEPGIHYPQFQMQSGVTGINTLRIYNPVKQAMDHDPQGVFIARWIPALAKLPAEYRSAPWATPALIAMDCGYQAGVDYPQPIVNPDTAIAEARARLTQSRHQSGYEAEAKRVYQKHGSRNPNRNGLARTRRKTGETPDDGLPNEDPQASLF